MNLRVWKSKVEAYHRLKVTSKDVFVESEEKHFEETICSQLLTKVHKHWKLILKLIKSGKGTNNFPEKHFGLKHYFLMIY